MNSIKILFTVLFLSLFVSCGTESNTEDNSSIIKKEQISGYVQKGPFVSGTSILMNELNSELSQTGNIFTSSIINDTGLFELNNIELNSSFVELTSTGFYFNEVTGELSVSQLTLSSLSDIEDKSSINVNVLTHLEKERVETLIDEGLSFSESKTQSRNELLSVFSMSLDNDSSFEEFDISQNTEEGGILLGISIILQGNRSVGELTELLSRIQNDFSDNGVVDNEELLTSLRTTTSELDFNQIRQNVQTRLSELDLSSTVPNFERYLVSFLSGTEFPLTVTTQGEGTVEERIVSQPKTTDYPYGTVVELTPVPNEGWEFTGWSGDVNSTDEVIEVTIDGETNITGTFQQKYQINITVVGEGTVEERIISQPKTPYYSQGTVVELTPIPETGSLFDRWEGDLTGEDSPTQITVDGEKNVTVYFRKPIFKIGNNGVTVICENVKPGEKGTINGIEYEVVDNTLLRTRWDEGGDMTKLCTSLVTDMNHLFFETIFNQDIGDWDVSSVVDMTNMFSGSQFNQDISTWTVNNVTNMSNMFSYTPFNQDISDWDVSSVVDMTRMFSGSQFNQDISSWTVNNVTNMSNMFSYTPFNQPIGNWNVGNVTDMSYMFDRTNFNQPLQHWDVSSVTNMTHMFNESSFNYPLGSWDVSKVTNMNMMFSTTPFNQDISTWCVENIYSEPDDFSLGSPLTEENKPIWGTCPSN